MLKIWMGSIIVICLSLAYAVDVDVDVDVDEQERGRLVDSIQSQVIIDSPFIRDSVRVQIQFLDHDFSNIHSNSKLVSDYFDEEQDMSDISNSEAVISAFVDGNKIADQLIKIPEFEGKEQAGQAYSLVFSITLQVDRIKTDVSYMLQEDVFSCNNKNKF